MPAPQASMMKQLARTKFSSFNLKVPTNWKDPDDKGQYSDALKGTNATAGTPDTVMPPLFTPIQTNKHHCDIQKMHNAKFGAFIDKTCDAICSAWSTWQTAASMVGFVVTGPLANGGQLIGPPWTPLILAQGAVSSPMEMKYTQVIATVLGTAWLSYTASIKAIAVPWWTAAMFATFPSPVVPPTPNTPTPITALFSLPVSLQVPLLKMQMVGQLADPMAPFHAQLFESIATAFNQCWTTWTTSTMVSNVLGFGAVPTCIPPIMPPGPVVGSAAMAPGGLT